MNIFVKSVSEFSYEHPCKQVRGPCHKHTLVVIYLFPTSTISLMDTFSFYYSHSFGHVTFPIVGGQGNKREDEKL